MSATITIVDDEITAEMQRAQEAEEELSNRITVNSEGLAAEISRATSSENSLSNRITVNAEGLAAEITRAITAESNEADRATEAEESLSNRITVNAEGLSAEITRATTAETTETNRAKSVEETLSNNITVTAEGLSAEITRATTAEATETGRAKAAEETLTNNLSITAGNLTSEIQRASTAEGNLGSRIDQTEAHILTEVQKGLNGEGGYTSIYQDAMQVATIVSNNAYTKKAGITIESDGIHMYSSQSSSNSTVDITPSAINLKTANLNVNSGNSINIKNSDGTNAVYLNNSGINLYSGKTISISSGASINVASGGKFTIVSTNFNIDNSGNVSIKGEVEASSGTIGGWTIGPNSLYSGTGSSYVALSTTGDYAIWAGNATASSAPFRVNRDGTVYSTKLITVKEDGAEQVIDLSKYSLWKLNYKTIKSVDATTGVVTLSDNSTFNTASSVRVRSITTGIPEEIVYDRGTIYAYKNNVGITLTNGVTDTSKGVGLQFTDVAGSGLAYDAGYNAGASSGASSVTLSDAWNGPTYTVTASNGKTKSSTVTYGWSGDTVTVTNGAGTDLLKTTVTINQGSWGSDHKMTVAARRGVTNIVTDTVDATSQYNAGVTDGRKSATLTASGWANGTNKVTNDYNSDKYVNVSVPSITSYNSITLSATDTGTAVSKSVTANIGGTTRAANLLINAKAVYDAGVTAGERHFSLATVTPQGSAYLSTATYYTKGTDVTLYKAGTKATYYKGDGSSGYLRGTGVTVNVASNIRQIKSTDVGQFAAFTYAGKTYYPGDGGYITGRGGSVEVTPIGDESTVTPVGNSVTRYSANPNSVTLYNAGTAVSNTYYTKNT